MHMLSQKDSSSDEMVLFRRSRAPHDDGGRKWRSANKRGCTSHDLDLFVTMQILDETPVILLFHQFSPERGHSYEWKNGETPRETNNGKTITCIMDNPAPLVVPGLSSFSSIFGFYVETKGSVQFFR